MQLRWTLQDLVEEVAAKLAASPTPRNGQVRAVPDERTIRYYGTIGLLDRPIEMRGRMALYGRKHIAQVVAIKRLQAMGRSLSEIQAQWPTLDDAKLTQLSGVAFSGADTLLSGRSRPSLDVASREITALPVVRAAEAGARPHAPEPAAGPRLDAASTRLQVAGRAVVGGATIGASNKGPGDLELRVELAPNVILSVALADDSVAISPADVRALRAAAAPLVAELTARLFASSREAKG